MTRPDPPARIAGDLREKSPELNGFEREFTLSVGGGRVHIKARAEHGAGASEGRSCLRFGSARWAGAPPWGTESNSGRPARCPTRAGVADGGVPEREPLEKTADRRDGCAPAPPRSTLRHAYPTRRASRS